MTITKTWQQQFAQQKGEGAATIDKAYQGEYHPILLKEEYGEVPL